MEVRSRERVAYVNGAFVPESQAVVSVFDRGFTSGDGAFDTMRTFKGRIFKLVEHVDRLYRSCRYLGIDPRMSKEEMARHTEEVVARNEPLRGPEDDYWVTQRITRGRQSPSHRVEIESQATVVIVCVPLPWSSRARYFRTGVPLRTSPIRRVPPEYLDPRAKVQNYLNQTLADLLAREGHPDDWSLILDWQGNVAEGSGYNFFIVSHGRALTAHGRYVLEGISRQTVFEICEDAGIPVAEADFSLYDVYNGDEAFVTGSSFCVLPVRSVDGRGIGDGAIPGPITERILTTWSGRVGVDIAGQYLTHVGV
jgi:branched-chain amino acid aminotransferase